MAAEIKEAFGVDPKLKRGSGGVFNVTVDGKRIFSKHETGRFPQTGEVVRTMAEQGRG